MQILTLAKPGLMLFSFEQRDRFRRWHCFKYFIFLEQSHIFFQGRKGRGWNWGLWEPKHRGPINRRRLPNTKRKDDPLPGPLPPPTSPPSVSAIADRQKGYTHTHILSDLVNFCMRDEIMLSISDQCRVNLWSNGVDDELDEFCELQCCDVSQTFPHYEICLVHP